MNIEWYNEPWDHFQVNEFLNENELSSLRDYFSSLNEHWGDTLRCNVQLEEDKFDDMSTFLAERFKVLLNDINMPYNKDEHEIVLEYDKSKPGFDYKIHSDVWTKHISFVMHVSEYGNGTRLYKELDKSGMRTIDWTPGGGGGFVNEGHHHSFDNLNQSTIRHTVIMTLRVRGGDWRKPRPW